MTVFRFQKTRKVPAESLSIWMTLLVLAAAVLLTGCGKLSNTAKDSQADALSAAVSVFQLPVPDQSYTSQTGQSAFPNAQFSSNVRALVLLIDGVASPLKESNLKILQVVREGMKDPVNPFHVVHQGLTAELLGTQDAKAGTITWSYTISGVPMLTGASSNLSATGNFTVASIPQIIVQWSVSQDGKGNSVREVSVRSPDGALVFKITNGTQIELVSGTSGTQTFTGKWNALEGGYYKLGESAKFCWNPSLNDTPCKN